MLHEAPNEADPFVDSLLSPDGVHRNGALRDSIRESTLGQVRNRARVRRVSRAGFIAIAFVGGMLLMGMLRERDTVERCVVLTVPVAIEAPVPETPIPPRSLTPAQVELEAERALAREESSRLFREAGNRFLTEEQNYQAAMRCYRNFLDEAGEADLAAAESDTWLLTSLKNARKKEMENDSQ